MYSATYELSNSISFPCRREISFAESFPVLTETVSQPGSAGAAANAPVVINMKTAAKITLNLILFLLV
ncbi:MAG: hypothetical protein LRY51_06840 [Geovibrio sp.]|nr:hypothetical protein [Geovibrio sp.]